MDRYVELLQSMIERAEDDVRAMLAEADRGDWTAEERHQLRLAISAADARIWDLHDALQREEGE